MGQLHRLRDRKSPANRTSKATYFDRSELNLLLSLYSRRVMNGEWRDYAIDQQADAALFSIYRHSLDRPLYSIAKRMIQGREPEYQVWRGGERLTSAPSLDQALAVFRSPLSVVT